METTTVSTTDDHEARQDAIAELRRWLASETLYVMKRKASRSGDKMLVSFFHVTPDRRLVSVTREVALILRERFDQTIEGVWLWSSEGNTVIRKLTRAVYFDCADLDIDFEWI